MREVAHKILDALPSKLFAGAGSAAAIYAAIEQDKAKAWLDWLMSPEQIRLWAFVGIGVFSVYWVLWWWTKPKTSAGKSPTPTVQTTHAQQSPNQSADKIENHFYPPMPGGSIGLLGGSRLNVSEGSALEIFSPDGTGGIFAAGGSEIDQQPGSKISISGLKPSDINVDWLGANIFSPTGKPRLTGILLELKIWNAAQATFITKVQLTVTTPDASPVLAQLSTVGPAGMTLPGDPPRTFFKDNLLTERLSQPIRASEPPVEGELLFYVAAARTKVLHKDTILELTITDSQNQAKTFRHRRGDWPI